MNLGLREEKEFKECREKKVSRDLQENQGKQALLDLQEWLDHRAEMVQMDKRVQLENQADLVKTAFLGFPVTMEKMVSLDLQDLTVDREKLGLQDLPDQRVTEDQWDPLAHPELEEVQEHKDPKVTQVPRAEMDAVVHLVHPELVVHRDQRVKQVILERTAAMEEMVRMV